VHPLATPMVWITKIPLSFGSYPDPDLGIFKGFFNIASYGFFHHFGSYVWIN